MNVLLGILAGIVFITLIVVTSIRPVTYPFGRAELKRRVARSAAEKIDLDRYAARAGLTTLFAVKRAVLLVLLGFLLVGLLGWVNGVLLTILVAIVYPMLARMSGVRSLGAKLYTSLEPTLLSFVRRFRKTILFFREPSLEVNRPTRRVYSTEDLADLIKHSEDVIGPNERALVSSAMVFFDRKVSEIMTPRTAIKTIKHSEFLGPLVLDELHALGHSRLPVIDKDLDHVVGILHLRDLLSLDIKRSVTAEKAMEKKVHYINQDDTLEQALAGFMKNRHHFYIVINNDHTTVGVLTLEDTLEALVGRKIGSNHIDL